MIYANSPFKAFFLPYGPTTTHRDVVPLLSHNGTALGSNAEQAKYQYLSIMCMDPMGCKGPMEV